MSKVNISKCTLEQLEEECEQVVGTQYGHNMIGIICRVAGERFGEKEADRLFELYQGQENNNGYGCIWNKSSNKKTE